MTLNNWDGECIYKCSTSYTAVPYEEIQEFQEDEEDNEIIGWIDCTTCGSKLSVHLTKT